MNAVLHVNPKGFAFAERKDKEGSIFIPGGDLGGGMDGDEVVVSWWPAERGPEGHVRSVVRRKRTRITGILRRERKRWFVEPDDPRIWGRAEVLGGPLDRPGWVVVGSIVDYPDPWNESFTVQVDRVLGQPGRLRTEEDKILVEHGIEVEFPDPVLEEAGAVPKRVLKRDLESREDLRGLDFMTIDPEDARDFDDAVCVELRGKNVDRATMRVHVAVADVSHYVRDGTRLDLEARTRSFSTYLPDRAIPMLPERLSSGICSLVPKADRCAMVVSMDLDPSGKVGDVSVAAAVIHSRMRLSYSQVAIELSGRRKLSPQVRKRIVVLRKAADRLRRHRLRRGAIELSLPETKIVLDEDDPERIRAIASARADEHQARAYNLIEELMLAANEAVARLAARHRMPIVYRIHDKPDEDRLERFAAAAALLGADVDPAKLRNPKAMQKLLAKLGGHEREASLNQLLLRSLAQAEYDTVNLGHFALASPAYVHFTSPIRRYPDLINHRVLKAHLHERGGMPGPDPVPGMPKLRQSQDDASRASERERSVAQAERDARNLFAAAYMRDRIGDRFEGTVTGLSNSGVFVALSNPFVDGMVRRTQIEKQMRDTYEMDDLGVRLVAAKGGPTLSLGDQVVVEVIDASVARRQIDLALLARM